MGCAMTYAGGILTSYDVRSWCSGKWGFWNVFDWKVFACAFGFRTDFDDVGRGGR